MPVNKFRKNSVVETNTTNEGATPLVGGSSATPMKNIYPLVTAGGGSGGTQYQTISSNGSRITYRVLSQTVSGTNPVVTMDKTTPLTPILTVTGGTIRLKEVRDVFTTASSVNPLYTFNATWDDAQDAYPSNVQKMIDASGQYDDDTTPQVLSASATTSVSTVQLNGVAVDMRFIFNWNNVE